MSTKHGDKGYSRARSKSEMRRIALMKEAQECTECEHLVRKMGGAICDLNRRIITYNGGQLKVDKPAWCPKKEKNEDTGS